jgi:hypothetical protein
MGHILTKKSQKKVTEMLKDDFEKERVWGVLQKRTSCAKGTGKILLSIKP